MADTKRKERVSKPSVASHPLFPAVVVVWFGALFGLASLAIHPAVIEGLVSATGIDLLIPKAAPPLGTTTRVLLALMMLLLGCGIGAIVARRLAKPAAKAIDTRRRRPAPSAQIEDVPSPVAMFGAEPAPAEDQVDDDQPARRRRQLAIMDASESFDDHAPLPGSTQILSVAELPLKSFDEVDGIWLHDSDRAEPRKDYSHTAPEAVEPMDFGIDEYQALEPISPATVDLASDDHVEADGRSNRLFESYARRVNAGVGSNDAGAPVPGFVSVPDAAAETAPHELGGDDAVDEPATAGHTQSEVRGDPAYANTAERIARAPLDALSHVELLERLALTIARRRQIIAEVSAAPATPTPAEPVWFSAPQTVAASGEMPAALRPHWMDADEVDDVALPAIAPPRTIAMAPRPITDETAERTAPDDGALPDANAPQEDPALLAQGYSSLQGMTKPSVRQVFGRSDRAEAAPVSPSSSPPVSALPTTRAFDAPQSGEPVPDQTEQALRAALATLRRMSGAA